MKQIIHKIPSRGRLLLLALMLGIAAAPALRAQSPPEIRPLTIGDTVPDIVFQHMLNYKDSTARLSDFKGKPVILDFFATWCGSCIEALPKLDSLQKQFGDSLQILVIDYEPVDKVKKFLENNKIGRGVSLPFVTGDSLLSYIAFPHRTVPHEVWIDAGGVVKAITLSGYVTAKNLRGLINNELLDLPFKKDMMHFDNQKSLFVDGNGGSAGQIRFRSTLAGYIDGLGPIRGIRKDSLAKGLFQINTPVLAMYNVSAGGIGNRLILEVDDKKCYIDDGSLPPDQWSKLNNYSYELIAPLNTPESQLHEWMREDLNRWLGLNARWEKRRVSCWALVIKDEKKALFKTQGGNPKLVYGHDNAGHPIPVKVFYNQPIAILLHAMNEQIPGRPLVPIVLDETRYVGNIDLKLKVGNIHDMAAMRKALEPYGLDVIPVQRELRMFVITEKDYKLPYRQTSLSKH